MKKVIIGKYNVNAFAYAQEHGFKMSKVILLSGFDEKHSVEKLYGITGPVEVINLTGEHYPLFAERIAIINAPYKEKKKKKLSDEEALVQFEASIPGLKKKDTPEETLDIKTHEGHIEAFMKEQVDELQKNIEADTKAKMKKLTYEEALKPFYKPAVTMAEVKEWFKKYGDQYGKNPCKEIDNG